MIGRRGFLGGLVGAFAAPAIVRVTSLMPLSVPRKSRLLTSNVSIREAMKRLNSSNAFLANINEQYPFDFAAEGAKIGTTLRIRLPNSYSVRV